MDLKGNIVTADAMNCQKGTAEVIIEGKGDYILALILYEEVQAYFDKDYRESLKGKAGCYKKP